MKATILGCGPSSGVPTVAEGWGACDPENPRNRRLRPSILVENGATTVLVDTSPDLRQQLLNTGTRHLDAVLYTHGHADHLHGIDDLRGVNRAMNAPLDVYGDAATLGDIKQRFEYTTTPLPPEADIYYKPVLNMHEIAAGDRIAVGDMEILTFDQDHGYSRTLGYRFGPIGFSTDLLDLPDESFAALEGVTVETEAKADGEATADQKVQNLLKYTEQHGPLSDLDARQQLLDLRDPAGAQLLPIRSAMLP